MKSIILIGAALAIVLGVPRGFSASVNERLSDSSSPIPITSSAADSDTLNDSSTTGMPFFSRDSAPGDTGYIDSLHAVHLFDSAATLHEDTVPVRIDSLYQTGLPVDTLPPRPAAKISEEPATQKAGPVLYPGLSPEQHALATQMLACYYNLDWNGADKAGKRLLRLEKKKHLPPLGSLLLLGMRVLRIQQGEYGSEREKRDLLEDVKNTAARGIELADPANYPDSCRATNQFIIGGINGFVATLDIENSPISAAMSGFSALKHLQKAITLDSSFYDAYLGMGMFNCILAKAPFYVRSALTIIGKNVSFSRGLTYLRLCATHGRYAGDIAKLYLLEFLSPYWGSEAMEKQDIFNSLERNYPQNPYFVFLDLDENLCFHKQAVFNFSYKSRLNRQISRFRTAEYFARQYANLVKWQYLLIDPFPASGVSPDTSLAMGDFSYYPIFLQALREKYLLGNGNQDSKADRVRRQRYIKSLGASASKMLAASSMPASRRNFFQWHIRDALNFKESSKE